ncbi:MAG: hypothetical protein VW683_13755, partial [Betaproteobacteria bacterium]
QLRRKHHYTSSDFDGVSMRCDDGEIWEKFGFGNEFMFMGLESQAPRLRDPRGLGPFYLP